MDPELSWLSQVGMKEYPATSSRVSSTQSAEELLSLSTPEDISEVEKAQLILNDGMTSQKLTIVSALPRLLMEPESEDLLTYVIDSVTSWSEELVIECGKQMIVAVEEGLILSLYQSDILQVAFQLIEPAVESVVDSWTSVVCKLMGQMPVSGVLEECVPIILRISDFSQAVSLRKAGTTLLSSLAEVLGHKISNDVLQRCFRLAQDTDFHIRIAACSTLLSFSRAVAAPLLQSKLFPEVQALVEDENEEVQREALGVFVSAIPLYAQDFLESHVMPVLIKSLAVFTDFTVKAKVAECFGEICVGLRTVLTSDLRTQFLGIFTEFANHPSAIIRKHASFNFPAVLSVLVSPPHITFFRVIYSKLCKDEKMEVRLPALAAFHEVVRMLPDQSDMLVALLSELLEDAAVQWTLFSTLSELPAAVLTEAILKKLGATLLAATQWRKQLTTVEICGKLLEKVNSKIFAAIITPPVFKLVLAGAWVLRVKCGELLADLVKHTRFSDLKNSLCAFLTETLGLSKRSSDRLVFLSTALRVIANNSKRFFKKNFLETVLALGKDPVRSVRILLSQHLVEFRKAIGNDHSDNAARFAGVLNAMMADPCVLIAQNAQEAHSVIMTQTFWKELTSLKEINLESHKVALENRQAEEEKQEQEEARKKLMEELTAKARNDFQLVKNMTRSRHSRKPTSIQISLSPVGKKTSPSQDSTRSHYYRGPPRAYVLRTYRRNK